MFKRALVALAMVGMVATPALADLLVPDHVINPAHLQQVGTIGIFGASINGNAVVSPNFIGGGYASQVSIPAAVSDTIVVTFAFHWPFSTFYPVPYLGVQFQNRLEYDNSEVQVLGATGAGVFTAVNFGLGISNSKMVAAAPFTTMVTTTTIGGLTNMSTNAFPGTSTSIGPNGTALKGFPNPSSGIINTAPGFGRFAVNPPVTFTAPFTGGGTAGGLLLNFSSTYPIMKVTLHVKNGVKDGSVDLRIPTTSAFALFNLLNTSMSVVTDPFGGPPVTVTNTFALVGNYFTGSGVGAPLTTGSTPGGLPGADIPNTGTFGLSVIPEPASAALMGIGLFSLAGGFWRRRRRMSC